MNVETLIWLTPLPPLLAFLIIVLATNPRKALSHWIAITAAGLSWLASMVIFVFAITKEGLAQDPYHAAIDWLPIGSGSLQIGVQIDPLSAVTIFFVAWTVLMIIIYSTGYHNYGQPVGEHDQPGLPPHGARSRDKKARKNTQVPSIEPLYSRFFALLSLFAFAMLVLVVSDNFLTLYIGWEIMGFCSFALIGFWFAKPSARDAAVKAFMTTRIGDMFLLLGIVAFYSVTGSLTYSAIQANSDQLMQASIIPGLSWAWLIGILIFIGVIGKSAQFPLHVWLPDAMEGPTPVSAMIHAAAMVSAGVYLALRIFPLITMGWVPGDPITPAMNMMAVVGAFTALFAATIALAQNDIKRVLAYSTISQLGFMIAALGVGAYTAAAFHLFTHAFFKALLFLGSGSVIHGMEHGVLHTGEHIDAQDMRNMGGLREKMPRTFWTFTIGGMALAGLPVITSGFWSKDEILAGAYNSGHTVVFWVLAGAALLTAFYTARQITLTFLTPARTPAAEHAHESVPTMTVPLMVLSVFAVAVGWSGISHIFPVLGQFIPNLFEEFVGSMVPEEAHAAEEAAASYVPLLVSIVVSIGGLLAGYFLYRNYRSAAEGDPAGTKLGFYWKWLQNKYYVDELYQKVFIKPSYWISEVFTSRWLDKVVIDGVIEGAAKFALNLGAWIRQKIDLLIVNKLGDLSGRSVREAGLELREVQTGKIQQYMLMALLLLAIISAVFIFLVLA